MIFNEKDMEFHSYYRIPKKIEALKLKNHGNYKANNINGRLIKDFEAPKQQNQ